MPLPREGVEDVEHSGVFVGPVRAFLPGLAGCVGPSGSRTAVGASELEEDPSQLGGSILLLVEVGSHPVDVALDGLRREGGSGLQLHLEAAPVVDDLGDRRQVPEALLHVVIEGVAVTSRDDQVAVGLHDEKGGHNVSLRVCLFKVPHRINETFKLYHISLYMSNSRYKNMLLGECFNRRAAE